MAPLLGCPPGGRSQPREDKIVLRSPLLDMAVLFGKDMACEDWRSSGWGGFRSNAGQTGCRRHLGGRVLLRLDAAGRGFR